MRWPWQRIPKRPLRPSEVIWPAYTLDLPCPYLAKHMEHFWIHPSGLYAACTGQRLRDAAGSES